MGSRVNIYNGISKVAWGYFFIYFDINIGTVSILPSFVGYLLFLSAIGLLESEERELSLLKPLGIILVVFHVARWLCSWNGFLLDGAWPFLDVIISLINVYYHFQMITNLAKVAKEHQPCGYRYDEELLKYRAMETIMLTIIIVLADFKFLLSDMWEVITILIIIAYLITGLCLMKVLFSLRKKLIYNMNM